MGGMFVAAITIPEAFRDLPGGLHDPAVFTACYFVVRAMHISYSGSRAGTTRRFAARCCGSCLDARGHPAAQV
jgi:hypothetical protein